jgi:hypothetical protein
VVIIVGHNDLVTLVFKNVRRIFGRWKHLPSDPSPEWYRQNLQTLVRRLKEETSAKIALTSLSQVGEDPESTNPVQRELNLRFKQYSEIILAIFLFQRSVPTRGLPLVRQAPHRSDEPDRSLTCSVSSTYSLVSVFLRSEGEPLSLISTEDA